MRLHYAVLGNAIGGGRGVGPRQIPGGSDVPRSAEVWLHRTRRPPQPIPPGCSALRHAVPDPRDPVLRARGRGGLSASREAVHRREGREHPEARRARDTRDPRRAREPGDPRRRREAGRPRDLHAAASHGRLLRVLDDAAARRRGPEGSRRAVLPVHERRGRVHPVAVHRRRDPARQGVRARAGAHERQRAPRARLRAGERSDPDRHPPRRRRVLLPPQDDARRQELRRADEHLHDLQQLRRLADPSRLRPVGRRRRVPRPARPGLRAQPRAVRRERPRRRQLHLQLLRMLLRSHDRGAQVRHAQPRPHLELPPRRSPRTPAPVAASA